MASDFVGLAWVFAWFALAAVSPAGTLEHRPFEQPIQPSDVVTPMVALTPDPVAGGPVTPAADPWAVSNLTGTQLPEGATSLTSSLPPRGTSFVRSYAAGTPSPRQDSRPAPVIAEASTSAQIFGLLSDYAFEAVLAALVAGGSIWLYLHDPRSQASAS